MGRDTVHFKCHHCNHCCTEVIALPTPWDVRRIVKMTGADPENFLEFLTPDIRTVRDRAPVVSLSSASLWHRTAGDTVGTFTGADLERVVRAHAEVLGRIDGTRMEVFRRGEEPARLRPLPDMPWPR